MKISDYVPYRPIILGEMDVSEPTPSKLTQAEIIAMQAPSTQKALLRSVEEDEKHFNRPLPDEKDWKRDHEISRLLDPQELAAYLSHRFARQHSFFYRKDKSSVIKGVPQIDQIRRARAIDAFYYTPPANVTAEDVQKAVGLVEYKSEPLEEVWVEMPWWKALWHRVRGGRIRQDNK